MENYLKKSKFLKSTGAVALAIAIGTSGNIVSSANEISSDSVSVHDVKGNETFVASLDGLFTKKAHTLADDTANGVSVIYAEAGKYTTVILDKTGDIANVNFTKMVPSYISEGTLQINIVSSGQPKTFVTNLTAGNELSFMKTKNENETQSYNIIVSGTNNNTGLRESFEMNVLVVSNNISQKLDKVNDNNTKDTGLGSKNVSGIIPNGVAYIGESPYIVDTLTTLKAKDYNFKLTDLETSGKYYSSSDTAINYQGAMSKDQMDGFVNTKVASSSNLRAVKLTDGTYSFEGLKQGVTEVEVSKNGKTVQKFKVYIEASDDKLNDIDTNNNSTGNGTSNGGSTGSTGTGNGGVGLDGTDGDLGSSTGGNTGGGSNGTEGNGSNGTDGNGSNGTDESKPYDKDPDGLDLGNGTNTGGTDGNNTGDGTGTGTGGGTENGTGGGTNVDGGTTGGGTGSDNGTGTDGNIGMDGTDGDIGLGDINMDDITETTESRDSEDPDGLDFNNPGGNTDDEQADNDDSSYTDDIDGGLPDDTDDNNYDDSSYDDSSYDDSSYDDSSYDDSSYDDSSYDDSSSSDSSSSDSLPQTGQDTSQGVLFGGLGALLASAFMFKRKKKQKEEE